MRTYKPTLTLRLLVALFLLLPAVILLGVAISGTNAAVTGSIGGVLLAIGAYLWWLGGRASLDIDGEGATRKGFFGAVVKLRFAEIDEYRYSSTTVNGVDTVRLTVQAKDGRKITVTSNWRDVFDAVKQLVEGAETHGLHEQKTHLAGKRVEFGPVTIDDGHLCAKGKRVPFAEIKSVDVPGAWLRVSQQGKLLAAFSIDSGKVPNLFLLLDELRARGVGAPDARPWRTVVSLSGYQLPKK